MRLPAIDAHQAEWLETDGLGGFAMGTVGGAASRRYHALLCAATRPPGGRVVLVNSLDEVVRLPDGRAFSLDSHHYPGAVHPDGARWLVDFQRAPWPRWRYVLGEVTVERELLMPPGAGATLLRWRASAPVTIEVRPLCSGRDYHSLHRHNQALRQNVLELAGGFCVTPYVGVPPIYFGHDGELTVDWRWYYQVSYPLEAERGLDAVEDLWSPGVLRFHGGGTLALGTTSPITAVAAAFDTARAQRSSTAPIERACRQFVVRRGDAPTVIAGYPWFTDWGRDTLIALPGLALSSEDEGALLRMFARHQRDGLVPNRFLDDGSAAEYNAADASLWFLLAIARHASRAGKLSVELEAAARAVVDRYLGGTAFGIHVDDDGFVCGAQAGVALTWMDARVDGQPITPRAGAPVELQGLWVAALEAIAPLLANDPLYAHELVERAAWTRSSFAAKFWYEDGGYLYDVVDGVSRDATLRPNQLYALGLTTPLVPPARAAAALATVERELLTPYGLRSRARDSAYQRRCTGGPSERDRAYHQGTVWPHLVGVYADACRRVRGDFDAKTLDPLVKYLDEYGMVPEIFDGDAPHHPRGCPAQAWATTELARLIRADATR